MTTAERSPETTAPHISERWKALRGVALLALAAVLPLTATPALADDPVCNPLQQGSLSEDGSTFTPGTGAADTDFRLSCTGAGAADVLTTNDVVGAINAFGEQSALERPGARVVLEIGGDGAAIDLRRHPAFPRIPIVVRGTVRGAGGTAGVHVRPDNLPADLQIDSRADVETTGGAQGLYVGVPDETPLGGIRLGNFGRVLTTGEGAGEDLRRGDGVSAWSVKADLEVSNEVDAEIETRGAGARGLSASVERDGTAKAVNRGSIVTKGGGSSYRHAEGLRASSGRAAEAVNEAGATVRTEGDGARGVSAFACYWTGGSCRAGQTGSATAINRGTVTTTGDSVTRPSDGGRWFANGVSAYVYTGGTARVVNEADASIHTEGRRALGMLAWQNGGPGSAEARNRGTVFTGGFNAGGIVAHARGGGTDDDPNLARAFNERGATVTTAGDGSSAVEAGISVVGSGTVDVVGSSRAENHGTVETSGGGPVGGELSLGAVGVTPCSSSPAPRRPSGTRGTRPRSTPAG